MFHGARKVVWLGGAAVATGATLQVMRFRPFNSEERVEQWQRFRSSLSRTVREEDLLLRSGRFAANAAAMLLGKWIGQVQNSIEVEVRWREARASGRTCRSAALHHDITSPPPRRAGTGCSSWCSTANRGGRC